MPQVKDKVAVCQLLLQSNANVEARDSSGWNLMHHAVALGHETVCRLLIASKANVTNDRCIRFLTLTFFW